MHAFAHAHNWNTDELYSETCTHKTFYKLHRRKHFVICPLCTIYKKTNKKARVLSDTQTRVEGESFMSDGTRT